MSKGMEGLTKSSDFEGETKWKRERERGRFGVESQDRWVGKRKIEEVSLINRDEKNVDEQMSWMW